MKPPNFLIIMSDEHAPMWSGAYGHPIVQTPAQDRLAREGVTFDSAYCNSPVCMPSRMSFMTGRFAHQIEAWDNVTPMTSDRVTWAHRLRALGYDVVLSGKQHFGGSDQLHGFQQQLSRDLHAERFHKIHLWDDGIQDAAEPWDGVDEAGVGITEEIEVDELTQARAVDFLRDGERTARPWALNVSFIAPHFPLIAPQEFWDLYSDVDIDLPVVPEGHLDSMHPIPQNLRRMFGFPVHSDAAVRRARQGYYALISFLDAKIGELLDTLDQTGQREDTIVVYTSDHGEMNGEHGMWRKSNFYEESARVPLQVSWPGHIAAGSRVAQTVSLVDLTATMCDVAGDRSGLPLDGDSFADLLTTEDASWKDQAFSEYLAHGVTGPMAMLRSGRYKLNYAHGYQPELYDLVDDPEELHDLAGDDTHRGTVESMIEQLLTEWDPVSLNERVRASQRAQRFIENLVGTSWRTPIWPEAHAQ